MVETARKFGDLTLGDLLLDDLEAHPQMVRWIKAGHDYHVANRLSQCLLCGNSYGEARKAALSTALDGSLETLLGELKVAQGRSCGSLGGASATAFALA